MSSIYVNNRTHVLVSLLGLLSGILALFPFSASAQNEESLSMTLTPPLFQVTQAPGGTWASNLRIVNTNNFDLIVTATVQDFRPDGESGNALFGENAKGSPTDTHLMSGWMTVPAGNIVVKRGTTGEIPFTISVPENADPGGHYAAILVGTSPTAKINGSGAGISSAISSLFFLRVPGDVVEEGGIRDFYAEQSVVQSPDTRFVLRFENRGNVHLVPEGSIVITNMWGKERGSISINKVNTFGNVLPGSTRKFEFDWHGEANPFEFGRYKALATIVYGEDGRKTVFRETYFWVIPWKQTIPIVLGFISFGWFLMWSIRRYIRKALMLERERLGLDPLPPPRVHISERQKEAPRTPAPQMTFEILRRPLVEPLRPHHTQKYEHDVKHHVQSRTSVVKVLKRYRYIIGFLFVVILGFSLIVGYFVQVFQQERNFSMTQIKNR